MTFGHLENLVLAVREEWRSLNGIGVFGPVKPNLPATMPTSDAPPTPSKDTRFTWEGFAHPDGGAVDKPQVTLSAYPIGECRREA